MPNTSEIRWGEVFQPLVDGEADLWLATEIVIEIGPDVRLACMLRDIDQGRGGCPYTSFGSTTRRSGIRTPATESPR